MTKEQIERLHFTDENIYKIEKWQEYIAKGHFGDSKDITNTYNEVFKDVYTKPQAYTSCGSCLRNRCNQMYAALKDWREYNASKAPQTEENPEVKESITEEEKVAVEAPKKRKKKDEGQEER